MTSNKIVDTFNEWQKKNPNNVPFQGNNLIANNVHVQNHLINQYRNTNNAPISSKEKNIDIIKKMLEPEKPNKINEKNNIEAVKTNFEARKTQQIQAKKKIDIQMTHKNFVYHTRLLRNKIIILLIKQLRRIQKNLQLNVIPKKKNVLFIMTS